MAGPLHDAIKNKQWSTAKELLAKGADPNEELDGQTATAIYMTVVFETMGQILNHFTVTLPEQSSSDSLLSTEDSVSLLNTFYFYAEILPYLSPETIMRYAMTRALLNHKFKELVKNILEQCRNFFPSSNPQVSMFELIERIKALIVSIIQESGVVEGASVQITQDEIDLSASNILKIQTQIKEVAASLGFELSEAQILSMMMIHSIGLDCLPEEREIFNQMRQSDSESLNIEPDSTMETESSETQPLSIEQPEVVSFSQQDEAVAISDDPTIEQQDIASLSINEEPEEEPSLNENATAIPQTLPLIHPEMGLADFLPPASH